MTKKSSVVQYLVMKDVVCVKFLFQQMFFIEKFCKIAVAGVSFISGIRVPEENCEDKR